MRKNYKKNENSKKQRKEHYSINFIRSIHMLIDFLRTKKGGNHPPDIESIISKEIKQLDLGTLMFSKSDPNQ